MRELSYEDFCEQADAWDGAVCRTPHIDRFCSSSAWIVPAVDALMPTRRCWALRDGEDWACFAQNVHPALGTYHEPLEVAWGFPSPFAGPTAERLVPPVMSWVRRRTDARVVLITGIADDSPIMRALIRLQDRGWRSISRAGIGRRQARLTGGFEGYLARRSPSFRANLRRVERRAAAADLTVEVVRSFSEQSALAGYDRALAIEGRSWKGRRGVGIDRGRMEAFYRAMLPRLAAHDRLRMIFVRQGDRDLAYHFGGVFDDSYRGLQHSYDEGFRRLALGTLAHTSAVRLACEDGLALYDLGMDTEYKSRWSDTVFATPALLLVRAG